MQNFLKKCCSVTVVLLFPICAIAQTDWRTTSIPEYVNTVNPTDTVRKAPAGGIIIAGRGDSLRAFSPWTGGGGRAPQYAEVANEYNREFDSLKIYVMPIPTQNAFYCPNAAKPWTTSERSTIEQIFKHLDHEVIPVNVFTPLSRHTHETIYSRTDHHWSALGAFYAAREFARVAGVPFKDLSHYDTLQIRNYVGTMSIFSKDAAVKRSPETFVYYTPKDTAYTTTYIQYTLDKGRRRVIKESEPFDGPFFLKYPDGSRLAYCTFVGGDDRLVHAKTNVKNNRRLLVLKDSFGNAIPGYLLSSFEEIHLVDCRYFTQNLKEYIARHHVTDILFANNISHACMTKTIDSYKKYLIQ